MPKSQKIILQNVFVENSKSDLIFLWFGVELLGNCHIKLLFGITYFLCYYLVWTDEYFHVDIISSFFEVSFDGFDCNEGKWTFFKVSFFLVPHRIFFVNKVESFILKGEDSKRIKLFVMDMIFFYSW